MEPKPLKDVNRRQNFKQERIKRKLHASQNCLNGISGGTICEYQNCCIKLMKQEPSCLQYIFLVQKLCVS
jgi:hypothetical protein